MIDKKDGLNRLAVCSWSVRPSNAKDLIDKLKRTGLVRTQIALGPLVYDHAWKEAPDELEQAGVTIVSGMFSTFGEDYSTLETIRATGGVAPDDTWDDNWAHIQRIVATAKAIGCRLASFHAGFIPSSTKDLKWESMLCRLRKIAGVFEENGLELALETGQEKASTLRAFLKDLGLSNVGVNFDPANMILYGKGDPVKGVEILAPWIRQVHVKDSLPTDQPGTWGQEVVVGQGAVDWRAFFRALEKGGFRGDLCIEREAGDRRVEEIIAAKHYLQSIL